jgi:Protein of unknown function (DUF3326)
MMPGIDVSECVITAEKVGVEIHISKSGASWGSLENSTTLLEGADQLIRNGCTAIAVVVRFPEDEDIDGENDGNGGVSVDEAAARFAAYRQGEVSTVCAKYARTLSTDSTCSKLGVSWICASACL